MGTDERRKAAAWAWYERRGGLKEKVEPKPSLGSHSKSRVKSSTSKSLSPSPILEKSRFHAEAVAATASKREWMDESSLYSPPTLPSSSSSSSLLWDAAEVASFEDLLHRTLVREEYLLASHIDHSPPHSTSPSSHHSCLPIAYLRSITPSHSASSINGGDLGGSEALIDYDLVQHPAYVPEFQLCPNDNNWPKKEEEEEEEEEEEKRRISVKRSLGLLRNNWSKKKEEEEEDEEHEKRRTGVKRSLGLLWRACENTVCRLTHMDLSKAKPGANNFSPYLGEAPEEESQRGHIHCQCKSKQTLWRESRNSLRSLFTTQPP